VAVNRYLNNAYLLTESVLVSRYLGLGLAMQDYYLLAMERVCVINLKSNSCTAYQLEHSY